MTTEAMPDITDPERLGEVLARAGFSGNLRVRNVTVESSRPTILSQNRAASPGI